MSIHDSRAEGIADRQKMRHEQYRTDMASWERVDRMADPLNTWEATFMESIIEWLSNGDQPLTDLQRKKLNEIASDHGV